MGSNENLTDDEIREFQNALEEKKRSLVKDIREYIRFKSSGEGFSKKGDWVDIAEQAKDGEVRRERLRKSQELLEEVEKALSKIENGEYGICEATGRPISKDRLRARPWSSYSVDYKKEREKERTL